MKIIFNYNLRFDWQYFGIFELQQAPVDKPVVLSLTYFFQLNYLWTLRTRPQDIKLSFFDLPIPVLE